MVVRTWEVSRTLFCEHVKAEVALEVEVVYPEDHLPDQPPRVLAHRCSQSMHCNQFNKAACVWAGTNPDVDPFRQ